MANSMNKITKTCLARAFKLRLHANALSIIYRNITTNSSSATLHNSARANIDQKNYPLQQSEECTETVHEDAILPYDEITLHKSSPSGKLILAATPIGNLSDLSKNLIETLFNCDIIYAEDTRRTRIIISYVKNKLRPNYLRPETLEKSISIRSYHAHNNGPEKRAEILELVEKGENIVLVSDAGAPGINDPGQELVQAAIQRNLPYDFISGPSSIINSIVLSGFSISTVPFAFFGFFPRSDTQRAHLLARLSSLNLISLHFEGCSRIISTLKYLATHIPQVKLCVCRELTKKFQTIYHGTAKQILEKCTEQRGEFTIVIDHYESPVENTNVSENYAKLVGELQLSPSAAIKKLSQQHKISKQQIKRLIQAESVDIAV
jgi:16S rRNA (cytidine1402-2'-O)-methyltransferase